MNSRNEFLHLKEEAMLKRTFSYFIIIFLNYLFVFSAQADVNKVTPPALQLANQFHENIHLEDYWVSEKLDGVRAYWDGKQLISRQGLVYQAPAWFISSFPSFALDGELWLTRGGFDELSGIVRKDIPIDIEWQKVSYQIFDLPDSTAPFDERLEILHDYFQDESVPKHLKLIPQKKYNSIRALESRLAEVEAINGEGLMLHKGSSFYHSGRDDDLLKLKSFQDAEAEVIIQLPGKGKYETLMGALKVRALNGPQAGRIFKIGSGFSDKQRANPPKLGSVITYKYLGFTSTGLPRFASFMRVRAAWPGN